MKPRRPRVDCPDVHDATETDGDRPSRPGANAGIEHAHGRHQGYPGTGGRCPGSSGKAKDGHGDSECYEEGGGTTQYAGYLVGIQAGSEPLFATVAQTAALASAISATVAQTAVGPARLACEHHAEDTEHDDRTGDDLSPFVSFAQQPVRYRER